MEDILGCLEDSYIDNTDIDLFNEECAIYVQIISALKKRKVSSESFVSVEESREDSENIMLIEDETQSGSEFKSEITNENDPHYIYALEKAIVNCNRKEDLSEHISQSNDQFESPSNSKDSSEASTVYKSFTDLWEESERIFFRTSPEYLEMIEEIMFDHYNVNRIGKVRFEWARGNPMYVMTESVTEWKSIYPIMYNQNLFFTIELPLFLAFIQSKYPNRAKIMHPRFILTRRAQTLNVFLSTLMRSKNLERFQVNN